MSISFKSQLNGESGKLLVGNVAEKYRRIERVNGRAESWKSWIHQRTDWFTLAMSWTATKQTKITSEWTAMAMFSFCADSRLYLSALLFGCRLFLLQIFGCSICQFSIPHKTNLLMIKSNQKMHQIWIEKFILSFVFILLFLLIAKR